jgi:two-component system, HptB-dependent secretion and biofilm response regulator
MTEKGFPLGSIVRELNRKVRLTLPPDRRVAAQLLAVDQRENIVSIWNGGMPPAYVLDVFGRRCKTTVSSHDPLGELADDQFDDRLDQHVLTPEEQIVLVSDGVLDCVGLGGAIFGEQGLADALLGQPRHKRYEETITSIRTHMGEQEPRDDMTLVLIDCESSTLVPTHQVSGVSRADNAGNWSFEVRLGAGEIGHRDVVPLLLHVIGQFGLKGDWGGKLFIVFSELFNNALDHGVLQLDSKIKDRPNGMEAWLNLREERLGLLQDGEIRLSVSQFAENDMVKLKLVCQDSGSGFDVGRVLQRIQHLHSQHDENAEPFGRGLLLIHSLADSVDYAENGRMITVLFTVGTMLP